MKMYEFIVSDILKVEQTKSVVAKSNLINGTIPYVTRTVSNNGYALFCGNTDKVNCGNCITIGAETGVAFYQPIDFVAGNKVYRLSREGLTEKQYLYIVSMLNKQTENYSYTNARIPEKIKNEKIILPVIENSDENYKYTVNDIDWNYMESYISQLEAERISQLEAYLTVTGLNDYELTDEDKQILSLSTESAFNKDRDNETSFENEVKFGKFKLVDLFQLENGNKLDKNKMTYKKPSINFVSRTANNNGVSDYVDEIKGLKPYPAGCLTLAFGGSIGSCFLQDKPFYTGQNIGVILFDKKVSNLSKLYIKTVLEKVCKNRFVAFGDEINKHFKTDLFIILPVICKENSKSKYTIDDIDFDYMEKYIRAIEKQTIANIYEGKGKIIEKTKELVKNI